jgi:hypothetical protein
LFSESQREVWTFFSSDMGYTFWLCHRCLTSVLELLFFGLLHDVRRSMIIFFCSVSALAPLRLIVKPGAIWHMNSMAFVVVSAGEFLEVV